MPISLTIDENSFSFGSMCGNFECLFEILSISKKREFGICSLLNSSNAFLPEFGK